MTQALTSFEQIASVIKEARIRAGYSQDDLADKAGVSKSTIQRIEEKLIISPKTLAKVESALKIGITIRWEPRL